jgi:paraquat-inducible protein A
MALGGRRFLLGCAVVAAAACLALACSLPFVRLTRPALFAYGHSLISGVSALAEAGQLPLAGVVLVLAIFLPLIKLLYLVLLATLPSEELGRSATQLRAIDWLGRWSPHDILAVGMALILMLGHDATAQRSGGGALFFAGAVLAMLLAYAWLRGDASARRMRAPAMRAAYATALRGLPFGALLALAAITFVLGVSLPAVWLTAAYAGSDLYSLAGLAWALRGEGEWLLGGAILVLGIVLPAMRLLHLLTLMLSRALPPALRARVVVAAEVLGRHATADTMILILMLFALVASGDAQAALQPGALCFVASTALTMLAYAWINLLAPSAVAQASSLKARLAGLAVSRVRPEGP